MMPFSVLSVEINSSMTTNEYKFLKTRKRAGVVHIIKQDAGTFCGMAVSEEPLRFIKKPSGRICAYCQNRLREEIKELVK